MCFSELHRKSLSFEMEKVGINKIDVSLSQNYFLATYGASVS